MFRNADILRFPIKPKQQFLIAVFAVAAFVAVILPDRADAFWPFYTNADAATNVATTPRASTPALVAPINSDPNISAPIAFATSNGSALISYSGPAGTIADIANSTPPDRISVYSVRQGDTLSEIADMFNVSVNTIIWANNLSGSKDVHPGDTLIILPISGIERKIVKGDTLKSLAKKYGADANEIAQFNGLDPAESLSVGSTVIIPGGEIVIQKTETGSTKSGSNKTYIKGQLYEPYLGGSGTAQPGYYINPVQNGIVTQLLHGWNAIDIGASRGTPIRAAAEGTVIIARNNGAWNGGYGNYVVIKHDNGTQTLYSHMTNAIVSFGQSVYSGQVIGYVGSTGLSTGPHLHFEVRGAANPLRNCRIGSVCSPQ